MAKRKKSKDSDVSPLVIKNWRFSREIAADKKIRYFDRFSIIQNKTNFILFYFFILRNFPDDIKRLLFFNFIFLRDFLLYKYNTIVYNLNFLFDFVYLVNKSAFLMSNFISFCYLEISLEISVKIFKSSCFFKLVKKAFLIFDFYKLYVDSHSFFLLRQSLDFVKAIRYNEYIGTNLFFCKYIRIPLVKTYNDYFPPWWGAMISRSVLVSYSKSLFFDNFIVLHCFSAKQGLSIIREPLFMNVFFRSKLLRFLVVAGISAPSIDSLNSMSRLAIFRLILFFLRILQENPKNFVTAKSRYYIFFQIFLTLFGFPREMHRIIETFLQRWEGLFYKLIFQNDSWLNSSIIYSFFKNLRRTTAGWSLFDLLHERFYYITANYYVDRGFAKNLLFRPFLKNKLRWKFKWYFTAKDKKDLNKRTNKITISLNKNIIIKKYLLTKFKKLKRLKNSIKLLREGIKVYKFRIKQLRVEIQTIFKEKFKILKKVKIKELKNFRIKLLNSLIVVLKKRMKVLKQLNNIITKKRIQHLKKDINLIWKDKHPLYFMYKNYNTQINKIRGFEGLSFFHKKFLIFKMNIQNLLDHKDFIYSYIDFNWTEFNFLQLMFEDKFFFQYRPYIRRNSFILGRQRLVSEVSDTNLKITFMNYFNWLVWSVDDVQLFFYYCLDFVSTFDKIIIDSLLLSRHISTINFFQDMLQKFSPLISGTLSLSFIDMQNNNDLILKIFLTSNIFALFITIVDLEFSEELLKIVIFNDLAYIQHFLAYFYFNKYIVEEVPPWIKKQPPFLPSEVFFR